MRGGLMARRVRFTGEARGFLMSSLGYAIVFLFCAADSSHSELAGARAFCFADQAACQAALADMARPMRTRGAAMPSIARCRSLDEICRANFASMPTLPRSGISAWRHTAAATAGSPFAVVLDILCRPDPGPGYSGE